MNKQEILDGISKLMDGDRSVFMNTHEAFREMNTIVLGESKALLTDNILERYDNEEYYDRENVLVDISPLEKIKNLPNHCFGPLSQENVFTPDTEGFEDTKVIEINRDSILLMTLNSEAKEVSYEDLKEDLYNILSILEESL